MRRLGSSVPQVLGPGCAALITEFKGTLVFRAWEAARYHHACCLRLQTFLTHFFLHYFIKQGLYVARIKCGRNDQNAKDMFVALWDFPIVSLFLPLLPQPAFHSGATTPNHVPFLRTELDFYKEPSSQVSHSIGALPAMLLIASSLLPFFR